ncbi:MAG: DivIVA domain-containing protein [Longimicrobiales bacterium]
MIDLTPLDVRKKRGDFRRMLRGYDPGEVDSFLEAVGARMEALVMENLALTEKAHRIASQLEALEGREKAVQEALVTAQKLREDVQDRSEREATSLREQAVREAESLREQVKKETEALRGEAHREAAILKDEAIREAATVRDHARREADLLWKEVVGEIDARIHQAEGALEERRRALEELERSRRKFLKGFRSLLEREMDAVEVEDARRPLEETPLELNLRGWPRGGKEEGEREGEVPDEGISRDPGAPDLEAEGYELVFDLEAQGGGATDEDPARGWGAMPGDEPPPGEFSDIVPLGVFDPESAAPPPMAASDGQGEGPEVGLDDPTEESKRTGESGNADATLGIAVNLLLDRQSGGGDTAGKEPPWLSNLLERDGGEEERPGVGKEPSEGDGEPEEEGEDEGEPRID